MYKGYTLRAALDEYAVTFFALLEEGYRKEAKHYLMLAQIAMAPGMKPDGWKAFINLLKNATKTYDDILKPSDDYSGIDKLRKVFGQDGDTSRQP